MEERERKRLDALRKPRHANVIVWDLETTGFKGDMGHLLCGGWKKLGEKHAHIISIRDRHGPSCKTCGRPFEQTDDRELVRAIRFVLEQADMFVTWNGIYFDLRFFNARLLEHRLDPLPPIPHWDGYQLCRRHFATSAALASIIDLLDLDEKTLLRRKTWRKQADCTPTGSRPWLRYIEKHCRADVYSLEQAYLIMRPFTRMHPNMGLVAGAKHDRMCPICGGENLKRPTRKDGSGRTVPTRVRAYPLYQCEDCRSWHRSGMSVMKAEIR